MADPQWVGFTHRIYYASVFRWVSALLRAFKLFCKGGNSRYLSCIWFSGLVKKRKENGWDWDQLKEIMKHPWLSRSYWSDSPEETFSCGSADSGSFGSAEPDSPGRDGADITAGKRVDNNPIWTDDWTHRLWRKGRNWWNVMSCFWCIDRSRTSDQLISNFSLCIEIGLD